MSKKILLVGASGLVGSNLLHVLKKNESELVLLSRKKLENQMGIEQIITNFDDIKEINGIKFLGKIVQGLPAKELRGLVDGGKKQIDSGVVVFIGIDEGKVGIAVGVTKDLTERFDAVSLVRLGADKLGGKGGGGRPDMAQAGGSNADAAPEALDAIKASL